MSAKLLTEHHLEFLRLKGGYTGSSESTLVKIPHFGNHVSWLNFIYLFLIEYSVSKQWRPWQHCLYMSHKKNARLIRGNSSAATKENKQHGFASKKIQINQGISTVWSESLLHAGRRLVFIIEPRHVISSMWHFDKCRLRRAYAAFF